MIFEKIKDIIASIGITDSITMDTGLHEDLGMDSTELADVSTSLAKEFGVSIKSKDLKSYTVSQIVDYIKNNKT